MAVGRGSILRAAEANKSTVQKKAQSTGVAFMTQSPGNKQEVPIQKDDEKKHVGIKDKMPSHLL